MKNLLVVVDMQNDFLMPDGKLNLGHDTTELRKKIGDYIQNFDGKIIATMDAHGVDSCEFKMFPPHCVIGTPGALLVKEVIEPLGAKGGSIIDKVSFTGKLVKDGIMNSYDEDTEVHVVGVCTHMCIHDVVADIVNAVKEKYNLLPVVYVHEDMVDDFDPDMAAFALNRMERLYAIRRVKGER